MRKFPLLLDKDVDGWVREVTRIQAENAEDFTRMNRRFKPILEPISLVWAAAIEINLDKFASETYQCTSVNDDCTVTAVNVRNYDREIHFILTNDGVSGRTVTFGSGFSPTATLVGTTSQTRTISFRVANGTLWEIARTAAR